MKSANYFILGEIFGLLERIELIHKVEFSQFDPDDEKDVDIITDKYIKPTVMESSDKSKKTICLSIAYYTTVGTAPIQQMKDRCQELSLPDADSWNFFFNRVGVKLFGSEFKLRFDPGSVTEQLNKRDSESLFRRS